MKSRNFGLALFILPWLIILGVPTLRLMLRVQAQGSDLMTEYSDTNSDDWANAEAHIARLHQELAVRYPNDARVQARNIETSYRLKEATLRSEGTSQTQEETIFRQALSDYDALIRRCPGQAWLVANRLRFTTVWNLMDRPDELDPPQPGSSIIGRFRAVLAPADLQQTMLIAAEGQRLEPDNNFYDWIIAQCLFGLRHDDEALTVLHQAALKPRYDAHERDDIQAELTTRELARPLLSEEKLMVTAGECLPHLSRHWQTARLAVAAGARAERAGDHQRALSIYQDVARLGTVMSQNNYISIINFVGINIRNTAWEGKARQVTAAEKAKYGSQSGSSDQLAESRYGGQSRTLNQLTARKFALYAVSHGRADIALETQREAQSLAQFQQTIVPLLTTDQIMFGISNRTVRTLSNLWWASASLLPQLLLNIALWLGLSLILRYRLAPRRESAGWLDVSNLLILNSCVTLALIALGLYFGTGWAEMWTSNPPPSHPALVTVLGKLLMLTPAVLGALLCGAGIIWRQPLNGRHSSFAYGLDCYRKMLGAFITLTGVAYLLLLVASLPARHTINTKLDIGIQQGEMALLQARNSKP